MEKEIVNALKMVRSGIKPVYPRSTIWQNTTALFLKTQGQAQEYLETRVVYASVFVSLIRCMSVSFSVTCSNLLEIKASDKP